MGNSYSNGAAESSVWSSQPGSNVLTPTWINTDSSAAPTVLLYVPDYDLFSITGDADVFKSTFFDTKTAYAVIFTALV